MTKYTIGVDFGSLSCRAVLVDTANGRELGVATSEYRHGVIDTVLPSSGRPLPPHFVLQDPADYLLALSEAIPALLQKTCVRADEVVGVGIDFTCCTLLPFVTSGNKQSWPNRAVPTMFFLPDLLSISDVISINIRVQSTGKNFLYSAFNF